MLVGLVGKPSSGKSTFFKALTLIDVARAAYPFTTIKPNEGIGYVKIDCVDREFNTQCNPREGYCEKGKRFIPVKIMDVAGLVPGAHLGKGLGLSFLDDLRQADVLLQIVDISGTTNEKGEACDPTMYDPLTEVRFLTYELDMWYLSIVNKVWEKLARTAQQQHQDIIPSLSKQLSGLNVTEEMIKETINKLQYDPKKPTTWTESQLLTLCTELRKKTKPIIIIANKIDLPSSQTNLEKMQKEFQNVIPCSAEAELALKEATKAGIIDHTPGDKTFQLVKKVSPAQEKALDVIKKIMEKHKSTGVQEALDTAVFQVLGSIAVFPGGVTKLADQHGNVLPDCFLMPKGTTALQFAYRLHSDLGNNFIRAIDVKTKRAVGKEHLLKNRDVIEIVAR